MAAQIIHAAGESSTGSLPRGVHAVALAAKSEIHLAAIERQLITKNISHIAIREPDSPWDGALMAIGVTPGDRSIIGKEVSRLPLIR